MLYSEVQGEGFHQFSALHRLLGFSVSERKLGQNLCHMYAFYSHEKAQNGSLVRFA